MKKCEKSKFAAMKLADMAELWWETCDTIGFLSCAIQMCNCVKRNERNLVFRIFVTAVTHTHFSRWEKDEHEFTNHDAGKYKNRHVHKDWNKED